MSNLNNNSPVPVNQIDQRRLSNVSAHSATDLSEQNTTRIGNKREPEEDDKEETNDEEEINKKKKIILIFFFQKKFFFCLFLDLCSSSKLNFLFSTYYIYYHLW